MGTKPISAHTRLLITVPNVPPLFLGAPSAHRSQMKDVALPERSAPDDHSLFQRPAQSDLASEYRSEFGLLTPRSSAYSPVLGSSSSRSSNILSSRSRSTTGSDTLPSLSQIPPKTPSPYPSQRPSTAPHSPILSIPTIPADSPPENHIRSRSRLAASIKSFLSRSTLASPSRFSLNSAFSYSETDPSSRLFHPPPPAAKWPSKSRPPNLDIPSGAPAAVMPSPTRAPNTPIIDAHRRYASDAVAKFYNGSAPPISQDSLALSAHVIRERGPKTRNVLRRRPSASAKHLKGRDRGRDVDHPLPNTTDVPLTPAGALAEAYKQQELFRDDKHYPPKLSIDDYISPRTSHGSGYELSPHSPTPHHTAFGSSAERRMQADSDDWTGKLKADQLARGTSRAIPLHQPSASRSSNLSLKRQVSTKWRKMRVGSTSEASPAHSRGHSSLQEVGAHDKFGNRSTGQSMDAVFCTGGRAWSNQIETHSPPGSEKAGPEGGKIWRLIRRISTGGLRDLSQTEKAVPPVPAIPKGLVNKVNQSERSNEPVSMLRYQPSSPRDKDHTSSALQNITSAAITSSSSNSSDVASTHFFHKSPSPRSSVSSYGEAAGASHSKEISLDRHIIAPIEQLRLGDGHTEGDKPGGVQRSPRRSASVPAALWKVEDEHFPLPSPRRQTTFSGSPSPACSRPPSVSGSESLFASRFGGLWGRQSKTADGLVSLSPPPLPPKHSGRGGSTSNPSRSLFLKQADGMSPQRLDRTLSGHSDTTARASPEPRTSRDQDTRTHFTYRELGGPRRPPLSEREKVDIWNDLLDRSDRAGGTLHIGGTAELMSDNMRFSMYSEA